MGADCANCMKTDNVQPLLSKKQTRQKMYQEEILQQSPLREEINQEKIQIHQQKSKQKQSVFQQDVTMYQCINDETGGQCGEQIDRVSPDQMSSLPHNLIGAILSVGPGGSIQYGTGILVSKDLVLTCAHVIYNKPHQAYYDKIIFYPSLCGEMKKWIMVQDFKAPEKYGEKQKQYDPRSFDYALLKLKEPVEKLQFIEICDDPREITKDDTLSVFGYPVSKYEKAKGKPVASKQFGLERQGYILQLIIDAGYIIHRISTEQGQSGAPVIKKQQNGKMSIIGIHIAGTEEDIEKYQQDYPDLKKVNFTKVLTQSIVTNLKNFAKELNGTMFKVRKQNIVNNPNQNKIISQQKQGKKQEVQTTSKPKTDSKAIQYNNEGIDCSNAKRYQQAVKCYRQAIKIDPSYINAYFNMGIALGKMDKVDEAIQMYRKILQLDSNYSDAYYNIGVKLQEMDNFEEAIQMYRKVIEIDPKNDSSYYNMGNAYLHMEKFENAIQSYRAAIKINPNDTRPLYNLGNALSGIGDCEESIKCYKAVIKINPNDAMVYNALANRLSDAGKFEEAIENYHKAIELDPNIQHAYENMVIVLKRKEYKRVDTLENSVNFLEGIIAKYPYNKRAKNTLTTLQIQLTKLKQ